MTPDTTQPGAEARALLPCPAGHASGRVIGGPGTTAADRFWAGCDTCNWRAWGETQDEAITAWNARASSDPLRASEGVGGEDAAWTWMENRYLNIEGGEDPNDLEYGADEMVDAFMAGAALALPTSTAQDDGVREAIRSEIINTPETADFMAGVPLEAAHQRERWSADHDGGKTPFDWFWLIGYLAQKAASAQVAGDDHKALHHTISTAAALANWHAQIAGRTDMRPGIGPGNGGDKPGSAFSMAAALTPGEAK